jgi:hypothetical protein
MQLPGPGVMGPPKDHEHAIAVLRRAVEAGVNHIDTAQYYGPKVSNELIREALYPYPYDLVIVSKVGALRDDRGGWIPAQRPEELRAGVERTWQLSALSSSVPSTSAGWKGITDCRLARMSRSRINWLRWSPSAKRARSPVWESRPHHWPRCKSRIQRDHLCSGPL